MCHVSQIWAGSCYHQHVEPEDEIVQLAVHQVEKRCDARPESTCWRILLVGNYSRISSRQPDRPIKIRSINSAYLNLMSTSTLTSGVESLFPRRAPVWQLVLVYFEDSVS